MSTIPKEGKWTVRMGEGNTIGIFKPLVPFNCLIDTDVGLIELIKDDYRSPDIFDIGLLDSFPSNKGIINTLYRRTTRNPLIPFMVNKEDIETANDLYVQFITKEYKSIIERSVVTGLYRLLHYFTLSEEIAPMISYSNDIELEFIHNDIVMKKVKEVNIEDITTLCVNMDMFFFKDLWDVYLQKSVSILKSKNIMILDYGYNFNSNKELEISDQSTIAEMNRCRFSIINAYNAKEIG